MIPELGHFCLILALLIAALQFILPMTGYYKQQMQLMATAKPLMIAQALLIFLSFLALEFAFLSHDFSVLYVANNSNTYLPLLYQATALWSAHEGSMMLWITVLAFWGMVVVIFRKSIPNQNMTLILSILGLLSGGFILFILATSNPFLRILPFFPTQGADLNPLLQDPGLALHPPMLYLGYVGFSVPFAFAMSALIRGTFARETAKQMRFWVLIPWCFLTIGITAGSWWSYRVLGWGGFWFWDPVENASFMPWLAGTALLHSLIVAEKRDNFYGWCILLAITCFSLSLIGTFLVRSGILISVHAFAMDPNRGVFILTFLTLIIGGALALFAWRGPQILTQQSFYWCSREMFLLGNNVILFTATVTVLLGTIYPLVIQALGLGKLSVGAPYFNKVFTPLILLLAVFLGLGIQSKWRQDYLFRIIARLKWVIVFLLISAISFLYFSFKILAVTVICLAFWVLLTNILYLKTQYAHQKINLRALAIFFAHSGVALAMLGIVITTTYSQSQDLKMRIGDSTTLAGYHFTLENINSISKPNYQALQAQFFISKNNQLIAVIYPERRVFIKDQMAISHVAIDVGIFRDLYIALSQPLADNYFIVRIYYKPFVRWIWLGGLLIALGGMLALLNYFVPGKDEIY